MRRLLISAAAVLALVACATPTRYQPAAAANGVGYSEQRIENDRWRVSFRGGSGAGAAQVMDYALLRAAELTLAQGYDWFQVVGRYTDARDGGGYGSGVSVGAGGGDWSGGSFGGAGIGLSFPLGGSGPALTTTLEIRMGRGARPQTPDSYDARSVQSSLSGRG